MSDFLTHITRSLGRNTLVIPPAPPAINESVARLQVASADLTEVFRRRATDAKMNVIEAHESTLAAQLIEVMKRRSLKSIVLAPNALLSRVQLQSQLAAAGIVSIDWSTTSLDASYDVDAGIGDVYRAVAETGSIVVRESVEHGRAVSLVPPVHFAVVHKSQIVPDLIDLMADVSRDGTASGIVIITGPSKTADIEMNLVTGVHGPGEVHIFLID